jgi:hypothetical protein
MTDTPISVPPNPIATHHIPFFITPPGQTDVLFHVVAWFVLICVIGLGVIFLTIHSLPERHAHRTKKVQLDIVAVLCLLALLTNEHIFWFAALLLAFIDFPDFLGPVQRIATAAEKIAGQEPGAPEAAGAPAAAETGPPAAEPPAKKPEAVETPRQKGSAHA